MRVARVRNDEFDELVVREGMHGVPERAVVGTHEPAVIQVHAEQVEDQQLRRVLDAAHATEKKVAKRADSKTKGVGERKRSSKEKITREIYKRKVKPIELDVDVKPSVEFGEHQFDAVVHVLTPAGGLFLGEASRAVLEHTIAQSLKELRALDDLRAGWELESLAEQENVAERE